jgi:hypothetical protein
MEILKFSEPPKRSSRTSTRKKSGVMPLLSVVAAVAIVGGMSSTLAGTITLNTNNTVEFGQGVVTAAACDTTMQVIPAATFDNSNQQFTVSSVTVKGLGLIADSGDATFGPGCKGKTLTIKAFSSSGQLAWDGTSQSIVIGLPNTDTMTANSPAITKTANESVTVVANVQYESTDTTKTTSTTQQFTLGGLAYPASVVRFTIESSG